MIEQLQANISERQSQIDQLSERVEAVKAKFPEGIADSQARRVVVGPLLKSQIDEVNSLNEQIAALQTANLQDQAQIEALQAAASEEPMTEQEQRIAALQLEISEQTQIISKMANLRDVYRLDSPYIAQGYEGVRLQAIADKNAAELELRRILATTAQEVQAIEAEQVALDLFNRDELAFFETYPDKLRVLLTDGGADAVESTSRIIDLYSRTVGSARGEEDERFTAVINAALGTEFTLNDFNRILVEAGMREVGDVVLTVARATGGDAAAADAYREIEQAAANLGVSYNEVANVVGEAFIAGMDTVELVQSPDGEIVVQVPSGGIGDVDMNSINLFPNDGEKNVFPLTKDGIKSYYAYINSPTMDVKQTQANIDALTVEDSINKFGFTYDELKSMNPAVVIKDYFPIGTKFVPGQQTNNAGLLIAAGIAALTILG